MDIRGFFGAKKKPDPVPPKSPSKAVVAPPAAPTSPSGQRAEKPSESTARSSLPAKAPSAPKSPTKGIAAQQSPRKEPSASPNRRQSPAHGKAGSATKVSSPSPASSARKRLLTGGESDSNDEGALDMDTPSKKKPRGKLSTDCESAVGESSLPFADLKIAVTGLLPGIAGGSRDALEDLIMQYGGKMSKAVSGKTSFLVAGEVLEDGRPSVESSKYRAAKEKKVKILSEAEFSEMLGSAAESYAKRLDEGAAERSVSAPEGLLPVPDAPTVSASMEVSSSSCAGRSGVVHNNSKAPPPPKEASEGELLWVDKYKPSNMREIIGSADTVKKLHDWLTKWDAMHLHKTLKIPYGQKDNPGAKAALLSGPPGIGKTTMAVIVGEACGYEVMELNASDARNKSSIEGQLSSAVLTTSINAADVSKANKKKRLVVMDEVDGMGGSDRGGIAELMKIIKLAKVPIICICNDRQSQKIRSLANHCFDLRVRRPTKTQIASRLVEIARKEGLQMEQNAAEILAEQVGNDIRQVINASQMWRAMSTTMKFLELKENMGRIEKDKVLRQSPFDACLQILGGSAKTSFSDRYDSFFIDYSLLPMMVQENYIDAAKGSGQLRQLDEATRLEKLSLAADAVSDMDIVGPGRMGGDMHWEMLPVQGAFCVRVGSIIQGFQAFPNFPKWLGKYSTTNKCKRITQELVFHSLERIGQSFQEMRLSYVPYLTGILLAPLLRCGAEGVPQVVQLLQAYGLSRDDLMESLRELAFVIEKDPVLKNRFDNLGPPVKSALTKQYNESAPSTQALNYGVGTKKPKGKGSAGAGADTMGGEDEDGAEEEPEKEEEVDLSVFQKKSRKKGAAKKPAAGAAAGGKKKKK